MIGNATTRYSYRPEIKLIIDGSDVTKQLFGEGGTVRINKSLYAPNGEAQITLPDLPMGDDSGYGYFAPMQPVGISMRRWREGQSQLEDFYVVFRGVIRSVGRSEQIDGEGRPRRFVHIVAHDCGAFFLMEQINALITYQNKEKVGTGTQTFLQEYLQGNNPYEGLEPVGDFLWDVATTTTKPMMEAARWEFEKKFFVEKGYVMPMTALSQEGPVWSILDRYADRPWNEFYVREGKEKPQIVFRPSPFFDMDGNRLPDFTDDVNDDIRYVQIPKSDVIALNAHRDDAELVNHVWVVPTLGVAAGYTTSLQNDMGIVNSETRDAFGDRIQIQQTNLMPGEKPAMNLPESEQRQVQQTVLDWTRERQKWLQLAGEQTHNFERGTLQVKGYASYRVGDYVQLVRAPSDDALTWNGYVIRTTHDFQAYRGFSVTLEYIRSNQWVKRQEATRPYWTERQRGEKARL